MYIKRLQPLLMLEYIIYHFSKENATESLQIDKFSVFSVWQKKCVFGNTAN